MSRAVQDGRLLTADRYDNVCKGCYCGIERKNLSPETNTKRPHTVNRRQRKLRIRTSPIKRAPGCAQRSGCDSSSDRTSPPRPTDRPRHTAGWVKSIKETQGG